MQQWDPLTHNRIGDKRQTKCQYDSMKYQRNAQAVPLAHAVSPELAHSVLSQATL